MKKPRNFIVLIISVFILSISLFLISKPHTVDYKSLTVNYIDIGQGDSVLIESDGKFMLIDSGKASESETVTNYLKKRGVGILDYVIWTHPDADHIGGAAKVMKAFTVKQVLMPHKSHTTKTFYNLMSVIKEMGLKITAPKAGNTYTIGDSSFIIIAPNRDYADNNNSSIGIKLINGNTSFVFIGDAEKEAITDMLENGIDLSADVLMTGHHGSDTSTTAKLLKAIAPDYAVISVGKDNSYGHPAKDTLKLLSNNNIKIYRTDEDGTLIASSDGNKITFSFK
jgi:competence protein ComEC